MNREAMTGVDPTICDDVYYRGVLEVNNVNMPVDDEEVDKALNYWTEYTDPQFDVRTIGVQHE